MTRILLVCLTLAACGPKNNPAAVDSLAAHALALESRLAMLEARVQALEAGAPSAARGTPSDVDMAAGARELTAIGDLIDQLQIDEAKTRMAALQAEFKGTRVEGQARRKAVELAVIGTPVTDYGVQKWFQGVATPPISGVQVVVFFEEWCPHCKRELPNLQAKYGDWQARGIDLVAFTKVTRSSTDERVRAFIADNGITYPVGHELESTISDRYAISGIPAAMLVKDGVVIWRGHPARISEQLLAKATGAL
jgi:thiol-disulfide isomerase/thioredoxin